VLQSIALLPNYSFCPYHQLFPLLLPSPPILPQTVTRLPLPHIYSPPADKPTIPTLHNPNPLQSLTEAPYTTTETHPTPQNPAATTMLPQLICSTSHLFF
jgi:hypothetical protein